MFVNVGVTHVIISDRGTNFTSQLTTELQARLGCNPTFNTPGHTEASDMVEWFNQTCKNMLSHVVREHKRHWHTVVQLMVWALREVPNATTDVSPYMIVYGRVPRNPLAVLKEPQIGERDVAFHLGKAVDQYLSDLKAKSEPSVNFAEKHSQQAQNSYALIIIGEQKTNIC